MGTKPAKNTYSRYIQYIDCITFIYMLQWVNGTTSIINTGIL
ncbi:hypothetical protein bsdcttw_44300 [Anaerocolumna chitinilytica]|uniref:Uncharacterized protein n=1 Tax=Anaerocolumna chitinilytica TaxID=1727145 RepID=A0A7M3S9X2_9FIRM|nr:hypothetical protein bsdcttw_44300 [Anaerocolumna chitinilytica]